VAREANGWGSCVECGEMLTPDDAEELGWSDRCRFCLAKNVVHGIINNRMVYINLKIKRVTDPKYVEDHGEKAAIHWKTKKERYDKMSDLLRKIKSLKAEMWKDECYEGVVKY